jgi:HEAT repeat protein
MSLSKGHDTLSDEKPETLLKSALEKIVYFEARSTQLANDLAQARSEAEHVRAELGQASQREIELRRVIAELEVRTTRAHSERQESGRVADALRRERADLIAKMLDASRIQGGDSTLDGFDLAQFIAQLRSEVLLTRDGIATATRQLSPQNPAAPVAPPEPPSFITNVAVELKSQGRLAVTEEDLQLLAGAKTFPGRSEETLFGFSVRELAAPDAAGRIRAAERLKALGHPASAPALATALNAEADESVQIAILGALSLVAKPESLSVVKPLLSAPSADVRIAALKTLLALDSSQAVPYLTAAAKDPDKAVRRRASLLALGLSGAQALELGTESIRDADADVRALAALVLGASQAETARPLLLAAMRDAGARVRRSAGQALSKLLGRDVSALVDLEDMQRLREVRRIANLPSAPLPRRDLTPAAKPMIAARSLQAPANRSVPASAKRSVVTVLESVGAAGRPAVAAAQVRTPMKFESVISTAEEAKAAVVEHDGGAHEPRAVPSTVAASSPKAHATSAVAAAPMQHSRRTAVAVLETIAQPATPKMSNTSNMLNTSNLPPMSPNPPGGIPVGALGTNLHAEATRASSHGTAKRAPVAMVDFSPMPAPAVRTPGPSPAIEAQAAQLSPRLQPAFATPGLDDAIILDLRAALRGRQLDELATNVGASDHDTMAACGLLLERGRIVRRGHKYFVA